MIRATCRSQFTADDFLFVVKTLSRSPGDSVSLAELLADPETRDAVLDHELIFKSLIDDTGFLKVSVAFYFYVLTRRVLREAGIEDRLIADYIATVLVAFGRKSSSSPVRDVFPYISDMLVMLSKADSSQRFVLRAHIADYSLFISGVFAERVRHWHDRKGAPDIEFYEIMGESSYGEVSKHRLAERAELTPIYSSLASRFREVRSALNRMTDRHLHLSREDHSLPGQLLA